MSAQPTNPPPFVDTESLFNVFAHIFFLTELHPTVKEDSLVRVVSAAAHAYTTHADGSSWHCIAGMLDNLQVCLQSGYLDKEHVTSQLGGMRPGDVLAFFIRSHESGILLTKRDAYTLIETFSASPLSKSEVRSYPSSAIEVPNHSFDDAEFQLGFTSFLFRLDGLEWGHYEQFITSLHNDILQSDHHSVDVPLITKHAKHTHTQNTRNIFANQTNFFRRLSPLWHFTKVVIQMSLDRLTPGRASYKAFMLFFMCTLAKHANTSKLSSDLLQRVACKIQRRLTKLESPIPDWLFQMSQSTLEHLIIIASTSTSTSPFRNPSQDEVKRDTRLSLTHSQDYIRDALANRNREYPRSSFHPNHRRRGTIHDFLSSNGAFFEEVYSSDPRVTLHDVEKVVSEDLDDWIAHVMDVDEACSQLEILMAGYLERAEDRPNSDTIDESIMLLTGIELFIALDKLVVKDIPMLANYSPEVPPAALETLFIHNQTSIHRLFRAYQYLSARQSRSRMGWSVLLDEESLPVRYYDQSLYLQQLMVQIEQDSMGSRSPLPSSLVQAKIVVFELQCPPCIRIWRSAVGRMQHYFRSVCHCELLESKKLLFHASKLRKYYMGNSGPAFARTRTVGIGNVQLAYLHKADNPMLCYAVPQAPGSLEQVTRWHGNDLECCRHRHLQWQGWWHSKHGDQDPYVKNISHMPNDVLVCQTDRLKCLPLDEFHVFGQLRSGGSLQWLNILHGLRSRTLNLQHEDVYDLLSFAVLQVGPLDRNTGKCLWHEELQDSSFCDALLDEVENLLVDGVSTQMIDSVMMKSISLLITRVLASSPREDVLQRSIVLLKNVRQKIVGWIQELGYDMGKNPHFDSAMRLHSMCEACLSTFDIDTAALPRHFQSTHDITAALSCTLLTYELHHCPNRPLHRRHLSIAFEKALSDAISSDPTDRGIDFAVRTFFPGYKPGASKWVGLQQPNTRWLACQTQENIDKPSQIVHLNLLDGELQIDGKSMGKLYYKINHNWTCKEVDPDQGFFVLPQMDPSNDGMKPKQKVHTFLRDDNLMIRVHCNDSKDILEWIPSDILKHDLPLPLLDRHIHWLSLSTGIIEIRPLEHPLTPSPENWRIDFASGRYRAYKNSETLVDIRSPTWAAVSDCFRSLTISQKDQCSNDRSNDLLITVYPIESSPSMLRTYVTLPRYGLSFFINEQGEIQSCDFKDMVYGRNPYVKTLFGVAHLFVLQQKANLSEGLIPQRVLVPDEIHITTGHDNPGHQVVQFKREGSQTRTFHIYNVDPELGCLMGNGSIRSIRQLAYMHAATQASRNCVDPFTGKTGIQAAISLLRSGGCRSVAKFKSLNYNGESKSTGIYEVDEAWRVMTRNHPSRLKYAVTVKQPPSEVTLSLLFYRRLPPQLPPRNILARNNHKTSSDDIHELHRLIPSLEVKELYSSFEQEYTAGLRASALHVRDESFVTYSLEGNDQIATLKNHFDRCRASYFNALATLREALSPSSDPYEKLVSQRGQWPSITGDTLLRCLASTSRENISDLWKNCLVLLAILLLDLQRARRLLRFALDNLEEEFSKELENEGCDGWDPEEYPDWLLIQIQGNFLIRRSQAEAAKEIICPKLGRNSIMQVNMGEGKSSVIIPIAAAALADGKQLVRIIVPKVLTVQMFDLLVARLGGLVNRPIYHLPFSRHPKYDFDRTRTPEYDSDHSEYEFGHNYISVHMNAMLELMSQCMAEHGILLVQPEHVTSLKLTCIEKQMRKERHACDLSPLKVLKSFYEHISASIFPTTVTLPEKSFVGNILRQLCHTSADHLRQKATTRECVEYDWDTESALCGMHLQKWIDSHVRDILDESDEILHSRFQLMYTVGPEQHMEGYSDRWIIVQQVLRLVKESAPMLASSFQVEFGPPGSFPNFGAGSGSDLGKGLKPMIIKYVMEGRIRNLDFRDVSREFWSAIRSFVSDKDILPDTVKKVEEFARRSCEPCLWSSLLVLRGLLASNILLFALVERRWRVDYGLVLPSLEFSRKKKPTQVAIPYRAKDMPTSNTQFGHPDITIILTCLSYYYSGLDEDELLRAFIILLDQDDPHAEYALWVEDYDDETLPESLRTLGEIGLGSREWSKIVFPLFSRNQAAIDLYLSQVVFPKEAKEFPFKLSASSWDLAEKREKVISGFSGTDDGRWLLPMSIDQRDLGHQQGTNARVLTYVLRPENDFYFKFRSADENCGRWTTSEFLRMVSRQQPEVRVLLDVGAQILDSSNHRVAEAWLDIVRDAAGAIYFNDEDELTVLMRSGTSIPLLSSSLSQQLSRCVVYLDHAHTRGTDLKLPVGARAAVTLGPMLTKDRLVQGCMRMRKLGRGHSVIFFAPPEVDVKIRALKKDPNTHVTTADILCWAIRETWTDIRRRTPYWAQQGMDHRSREDAWSRFCDKGISQKQLSDVWLQPAARSLEDLYAPQESKYKSSSLSVLDSDIRQHCRDLGITSLSCVQVEEQEREAEREREREWESERSPKAEPAEHFLHPDVAHFVRTGIIPALHSSSAFHPIFTTLDESTAATREGDVWSPSILATTDFCNTIKPESIEGTIDQYLRPVQWVVSSKRDKVLALMSPFEINLLIEDFRASEDVHLHMYAPRTSLRMKPSDDLRLYTIPPLPSDWTPPWELIDQLNLFSGQLYLSDYKSYLRLCRFLGVPTNESPKAASDRRNLKDFLFDNIEESESKFSRSPLPSVLALLTIRNRGKPFGHTHMGKILYGQLLRQEDVEGLPKAVPRRSNIECEEETSICDVSQLGLGQYILKRKLEMMERSSGDSAGPQSKRPRFD